MLSVRLLTLTHTVFKPTADSILWTLTHGLEEKQLFILHINENYSVLCGFISGPEVGRLQCLSNLMKPLQHLCLVPTRFNELKERLFKLFLVEGKHLSQYQTDTEPQGEARNACSIRPTQPLLLLPLCFCRHCSREPENGVRRGERPRFGNFFRWGAVAYRCLSEEQREQTYLCRGSNICSFQFPFLSAPCLWKKT